MRRTLLFIPSNNANMIINGGLLGADSIIFDLEDAVSPAEKDAARELLKNSLLSVDFGKCSKIVRINGLDTAYWKDDLDAIIPEKPDFIMPPKTSGADYIKTLDAYLTELEKANGIAEGSTKIIALIETALGIENAFSIAKASPRMAGLFLGSEDLAADLQCTRTSEGTEILYARSRILYAARAAGIDAYDTPFVNVDDLVGLEADAKFAKQLGFTGKASISPGHISTINEVFSPSASEIQYAKDVFAALEEGKKRGKGAVTLRGKMIDAPIVLRAQSVLDAAREIWGGDV